VHDPDRYPLLVGNHVLGGGMASRLFQEVREERGLSYGIYTSPALYSDAGLVVLSVSTAPARLAELLEVVDATIEALLDDGITATEHRVALGYLEGATLLGLEDTGSRMGRLASNELVFASLRGVEEHLEAIRAVTLDDVSRVLRSVFDTPRVVAAVGDGASSNPLLERAAGWRR
jgi:predicted Zn-dependent peptidase